MIGVHRIPRSTSVTTRTPLLPRRDAAVKGIISDFPKEEYFCIHHWTAVSALNCLANFDFSRGDFYRILLAIERDARVPLPVGQITA
jgi:hypothetical protein